MKKFLSYLLPLTSLTLISILSACDDSKTYAELLADENKYVNNFLADHKVINSIPEDTVFITGENAPYYRLDDDGNLYMQVVSPGTPGNKAKENELLYFRFSRYNLVYYKNGLFGQSEGNDEVLGGNYSFRYGNYELNSTYSLGAGIQAPLEYVPVDAVVNIVIKSQYGMPSEISYVQPFLYSIRYFRPKI